MRTMLLACLVASGCGSETSGADHGGPADQSVAHDLAMKPDQAQTPPDAAAPDQAADDAAAGDMSVVDDMASGPDLPIKMMPDLAGADLPIKMMPDLAGADLAVGKGMCNSNGDCAKVDYCAFPNQPSCNPPGTCQPRPQACIQIFDPVCGCDGKDYSNSCFAAAAGQNYAHKGKCP